VSSHYNIDDHIASKVCASASVSRDNLDENGWRRSEREAAAGSGVMISLGLPVRKHFLRGAISSDARLSDR
jgi:hypothetical protein